MRRSLAIGSSLTRSDVEQPIEACDRLLTEREQITAILGELGRRGVRRGLPVARRVEGQGLGRRDVFYARTVGANLALAACSSGGGNGGGAGSPSILVSDRASRSGKPWRVRPARSADLARPSPPVMGRFPPATGK